MSIYTRDNINYPAMLQGAVSNMRAEAKRRADAIREQGQIWSQYASKGVPAALDTIYGASKEPTSDADLDAEIAELEAAIKAINKRGADKWEMPNPDLVQRAMGSSSWIKPDPDPRATDREYINYLTSIGEPLV